MTNRKKKRYRFNGHPSFNAGSIHSVGIVELGSLVKQYEARLADPDDPDDKKWTERRLNRLRKELDKKIAGMELKRLQQPKHRRTKTKNSN